MTDVARRTWRYYTYARREPTTLLHGGDIACGAGTHREKPSLLAKRTRFGPVIVSCAATFSSPHTMTTQQWNPDTYARNARFVSDLGAGVFEWLSPKPGEQVLDLGCGDGALTEKLVAAG